MPARETKFRYYLQHIVTGEWWKLDYPLSEIMEQERFVPYPHYKLVAVVQFTGKMDINDREMLEDDIATSSKTQGIIAWDKQLFQWYLRDDYFNDRLDCGPMEILGNIHQNPEMGAK